MKYDVDKLVLLTSRHGEKFLGTVPNHLEAKAYVQECAHNNVPVVLENVRLFHSQAEAKMNQAGQVLGIQTFAALLPLPLFSGPAERLHVMVSTWLFPSESPSGIKKIEELLEAAEKNERINQAQEAGLHIPGRS